jgi:hypothetical protein
MNSLIMEGARVAGRQLPPVSSARKVDYELAELARIYGDSHHADWKAQALARIAKLQTATSRVAGPDDYGIVLWSVGNPDHGQYHGPGVGSPTVFATVSNLADIPPVVAAYIGCYDLGGGNCPSFPVFRRQVQVADVSFNGRLWVPGTRREIDPETGGAL